MAGTAAVCRLQVGVRLARCLAPIVTAKAGAECSSVIEFHLRPRGRDVTILANIGCRKMISGLASGRAAIMAREAVAGDALVVERADIPVCGGVAGGAFAAGWRVIAWLALGLRAVVTTEATASCEGMVKAGY